MREVVRGYATAVFDSARRTGTLARVLGDLDGFSAALVASEDLHRALADQGIPASQRRAVAGDLLAGKVDAGSAALVAFAIGAERAGEFAASLAALRHLAAEAGDRADRAEPLSGEPVAGRSVARDRIRGYTERALAELGNVADIDRIEDELFSVARVVESNDDLRQALTNTELPVQVRAGVMADLLHGKVRPASEHIATYILRAGNVRDLVRTIEWVVELAAAERGRRIAEVRTAVDLDAGERAALATALTRTTGRAVEVRVVIDPAVIGGMHVTVGDTVIDGTVRHKLDGLRDFLSREGSLAAVAGTQDQ